MATKNLLDLLDDLQTGNVEGANPKTGIVPNAGNDPRAQAIQRYMQMQGAESIPNLGFKLPNPKRPGQTMKPGSEDRIQALEDFGGAVENEDYTKGEDPAKLFDQLTKPAIAEPPAPSPESDLDFMQSPKQQFEKPGMKTEAELEDFISKRGGGSSGPKYIPPAPGMSGMAPAIPLPDIPDDIDQAKQMLRQKAYANTAGDSFGRDEGLLFEAFKRKHGDYDVASDMPGNRGHEDFGTDNTAFEGLPGNPDFPSNKDYRKQDYLADDPEMEESFQEKFGDRDYRREDPNFIPLPRSKNELEIDKQGYPRNPGDDDDAVEEKILKDQIEGIPREGLDGMPLENLKELYKFQRRQRGEPEGEDEKILEDVRKQMGLEPKQDRAGRLESAKQKLLIDPTEDNILEFIDKWGDENLPDELDKAH